MRARTLSPILILAVLMAIPVTSSEVQGQNGNRELLGVFDLLNDPVTEAYPGINGGQGELATYVGYYEFWGKAKTSGSGYYKEQGYLTGYEYLVGEETGDEWYGIMEKAPILWHYGKDGSYFLHEPVHMIYYKLDENGDPTDERVRIQWRFHIKIDGEGNVLQFDTGLVNWHYWPGK
ncbi:hypothetical protein ACFL4Y_00485 [Gemmatimonadota bacterium]